jgi:ADP-glucose pyrophosphorylase
VPEKRAGGSRPSPLTAERSKPSVFNGKHRIVDFMLSNLVNSEIDSIYGSGRRRGRFQACRQRPP